MAVMKMMKVMMTMLTMMTTMALVVVAVPSISVLDGNGHPHQQRERRDAGDPSCPALYRNYRSTHTRCLTDKQDATEVPLGQDIKDSIVNYHNQLRTVNVTNPTAANMQKLVWDDTLALSARKLAMQCPTDHDQMKDRAEPEWPNVRIGQNLGMGHATFKGMIDRMFTERDRYHYVYGGDYVPRAGHYVQLVTANTNRIGCAYAKCPNTRLKRFRVCNYAEALISNVPPYKSGAPCSACPNHCDSTGKLCDCRGKLCYNLGELDVATCQCKCRRGRKGENCERLDCDVEDFFDSCKRGFVPAANCGVKEPVMDPTLCPHLCGLCGEKVICDGKKCYDGFKLDTDTCTCECGGLNTVVNGKCVPCASLQCQHTMVNSNCKCQCGNLYSGQFCETCLPDQALCAEFTEDKCDDNLLGLCPVLCHQCDPIMVEEEPVPNDYDANSLVDIEVPSTDNDMNVDPDGVTGGGDGGGGLDAGAAGAWPQRGSCRVWVMMMTMMLTTELTIWML